MDAIDVVKRSPWKSGGRRRRRKRRKNSRYIKFDGRNVLLYSPWMKRWNNNGRKDLWAPYISCNFSLRKKKKALWRRHSLVGYPLLSVKIFWCFSRDEKMRETKTLALSIQQMKPSSIQ
jgi:hypothetical protein